jgi:hypothetical protein
MKPTRYGVGAGLHWVGLPASHCWQPKFEKGDPSNQIFVHYSPRESAGAIENFAQINTKDKSISKRRKK